MQPWPRVADFRPAYQGNSRRALERGKAESYSTFMLTTIIDLPDDGTDDPVWDVIDLLDFDYFDDFPAIAPTRTTAVLMTPSGNEFPNDCSYN